MAPYIIDIHSLALDISSVGTKNQFDYLKPKPNPSYIQSSLAWVRAVTKRRSLDPSKLWLKEIKCYESETLQWGSPFENLSRSK